LCLQERSVYAQRDDGFLADVQVFLDVQVHHPRCEPLRNHQHRQFAEPYLARGLQPMLPVDHDVIRLAVAFALHGNQGHYETDALDRLDEMLNVRGAGLTLVPYDLEPIDGQGLQDDRLPTVRIFECELALGHTRTLTRFDFMMLVGLCD
jgi:hypothetical protein